MNESWSELDDAAVLACARAEHPAFRSGAELDRIDPAGLSVDERVDLLAVLEEQRRWFEAAQLRVLAAMQERDTSKLGLAQESVSLALQVPLRTAQGKLAQARTLVAELPKTLAAVAGGSISGEHARVLAEAVWQLPNDPDFCRRRWSKRCYLRCWTAVVSRCPSSGSGSAARRCGWIRQRLSNGISGHWQIARCAISPKRTVWPAFRCCSVLRRRS
jgi:hypothetical protein